MPTIDTRHAERSSLFKFLMAKETGDIDSQIAHMMAVMEPEDIVAVTKQFENWKANYKKVKESK